MEKLAKLHYINLAFIPRERDVGPPKQSPFSPKQKSPSVSPQTKNLGTATAYA